MAIIKRKYRTKKQQKPVIFYRAEVYVEGVRISAKTFSTKREATLWHEKEKNKLTLNPQSLNDQMLLRECVDKFWEEAQTRMMKSTLQSYQSELSYIYNSPLAHIKMAKFKGIHVIEWINWLKKQDTAKNKRRKSFVKDLNLLKTILNWYKNFLNENFNVPITKKHREICVFKPIAPRRPDYFIQPEDARNWIKWLKEHRSNPVYWQLASFMLLTGARVSEACGLKWNALDLGIARVIRRVRWDRLTRKPFLEEVTKTSQSARLLVLPKRLQDILLEMKKEAINDLVFTNNKGELLKYNAIQSAFNAGFVALKLPWRSTHILRHTFATMALMGTNNLSAVQASLGHTEQKMTQKYAKAIALLSSDIGEKTSSILFDTAK